MSVVPSCRLGTPPECSWSDCHIPSTWKEYTIRLIMLLFVMCGVGLTVYFTYYIRYQCEKSPPVGSPFVFFTSTLGFSLTILYLLSVLFLSFRTEYSNKQKHKDCQMHKWRCMVPLRKEVKWEWIVFIILMLFLLCRSLYTAYYFGNINSYACSFSIQHSFVWFIIGINLFWVISIFLLLKKCHLRYQELNK